MADRPNRFGIAHLPHASRQQLQDAARGLEERGFDFVAAGDHLGGASPFALLTAAAAVTERVRLRTYVLNAGFWVPALLAREAATLDVLSDGRLELGIGVGAARDELLEAGLPWRPARERVAAMERTLLDVRARLADDAHSPTPVQRPIPILVGGMSRTALEVAADSADIVAFSALRHARGRPAGTLTAVTAEETDALVAHVRSRLDGRRPEFDVLLQAVRLDADPLTAARAAVGEEQFESIDPLVLADSPCVLFARTAANAAGELERRRACWGISSFTTFPESAEALARVRSELA